MRQDEIYRIERGDFDRENKMLLIRERKDPRRKTETISVAHYWMLADMTPDQLLRRNVSFLKVIADVYFHAMGSLSAQPFADYVENSRSRTFAAMTCAPVGYILAPVECK